MPRALKVCSKPGCPTLTTEGRCAEHRQAPWAGSDRRSRLPADWPRRRLRVLRRDGWRCQIRRPGCKLIATEVDHVVNDDNHDEDNLQSACHPCHAAKTQEESAQARQGRTQ